MTSNCRRTTSRAFPGKCGFAAPDVLGLPDGITACLFDMDGVVTKTAVVHAAAWKEMFDEFLRDWSARNGEAVRPVRPGP